MMEEKHDVFVRLQMKLPCPVLKTGIDFLPLFPVQLKGRIMAVFVKQLLLCPAHPRHFRDDKAVVRLHRIRIHDHNLQRRPVHIAVHIGKNLLLSRMLLTEALDLFLFLPVKQLLLFTLQKQLLPAHIGYQVSFVSSVHLRVLLFLHLIIEQKKSPEKISVFSLMLVQ